MVQFISAITPMRYAVERNFRCIVKGQKFEPILLNMFGFTLGADECLK